MTNLFVPYEIAKTVKIKKFDEPCISYYDESKHLGNNPEWLKYNSRSKVLISAPTYSQVVDWLREKHNLHLAVNIERVPIRYFYWLCRMGTTDDIQSEESCYAEYDTYYESMIKGIEEALKLI